MSSERSVCGGDPEKMGGNNVKGEGEEIRFNEKERTKKSQGEQKSPVSKARKKGPVKRGGHKVQ